MVRVGIVPHVHWDREWHTPFPATRLRLVAMLDVLLPALEEDTTGTSVCLDGQTAMVDDYLELRPQAEGRLRRLVASGRLAVGPFTVPPDEFCVSGETLVRNLEAGLARAVELGGAMGVGYLPDTFGHVAQLPQILVRAGIGHAVVWRGVPAALETTAFWWTSPDGSRVRAEYLYGSYANGRCLPEDPAGLLSRAGGYDTEVGGARVGGLLLMNGGDQRLPQLGLVRAVADANRAQGRYRLEVTALEPWLAAEPTDGLPVWEGELRSGARAHLLPGVVSARVDLKRAAAAAERALERRAEPLLALFRPEAEWVAAEPALGLAWRQVVLNSAHDSACGCVADEVARQVGARYAEATQTGEALATQAMAALAAEVDARAGAVLVANTLAHSRRGLVEVEAAGEPWPGSQVIDRFEREVFAATVAGGKVGWVLDLVGGEDFDGRPVRSYEIDGDVVTLRVGAAGPSSVGTDLAGLRAHLVACSEGDRPVSVRAVEGPLLRILVETGGVDGFGWTVLDRRAPAVLPPPVTAGGGWLDNGLVRVEIDPERGTLRLATDSGLVAGGLGHYVDGGDGGDTYTWSPPVADRLVADPVAVEIEAVETGPLRARLAVTTRYHWPAHALGDEVSCTARSADTVTGTVRTVVELVAGDPVVGLDIEVDNTALDHRLRAHFPLPAPVDHSQAECTFAVVRRGLEAEGGLVEPGVATFPARRFVDCTDGHQGLAMISDAVMEYELVDGGRTLAVTLLRSVGFLSRRRPALRPEPAGPPVPTPGAQLRGRVRRRLGLLLHSGRRPEALYRRADNFLTPLATAVVPGSAVVPGTSRPPRGQALAVDGAQVSAVTRRPDGSLAVRIFNPSGTPVTATVGATRIDLGPGEIATVNPR